MIHWEIKALKFTEKQEIYNASQVEPSACKINTGFIFQRLRETTVNIAI